MNQLEIICRKAIVRRWEVLLVEQLRAAGYAVSVRLVDVPRGPNDRGLDRGLGLARRKAGASLADPADPPGAGSGEQPQLIIDLAGAATASSTPVLSVELMARASLADGLAVMLATKQLPELVARIDGVAVGHAAPMLENRVLLARLANSVLAGGVWLILQTVSAFFEGRLEPIDAPPPATGPAPDLWRTYLPHLAAGLLARTSLWLSGRRDDHWQVGYRMIEGPGVAETGRLDGAPFSVLPDDGRRFYADPFVVERDGRHFLFVEELPYATRKGVISASEMGPDGRFGTPRPVIEEPHHLSYPQIIEEGGEIYMLPESSGGRELVLYRAAAFPYGWVRDTALLADANINDATLLVRDGRYWIVGTQRLDMGSPSDTMVVYSAPSLRGPWTPHPRNPIVIHRAGARPGGAMVLRNGRVAMPVQNGSRSYGGGLGLMDLIRLNDHEVAWGPVRPIGTGPAWDRQGLHTLNRAGRLEVVDSTG